MLLLLSAPALAVTPYAGVEWRPLSRGDLAWVDEGDTTGLLVGGLDGFARPQLVAYVGAWATQHIGAHASLGVARLTSTSWVGETWTQRHWGVVRPGLDLRASLLERRDRRPIPWLVMGAHVDVPSARDGSNGYTQDEDDAANQTATIDRVRLGAIGWRLGAGADLQLVPGLAVGLQWTLEGSRSMFKTADPTAVTSWITAEGALLLEFHWPERADDDDTHGDDAGGEDGDDTDGSG